MIIKQVVYVLQEIQLQIALCGFLVANKKCVKKCVINNMHPKTKIMNQGYAKNNNNNNSDLFKGLFFFFWGSFNHIFSFTKLFTKKLEVKKYKIHKIQ